MPFQRYPLRFHAGVSGCTWPVESVARDERTNRPLPAGVQFSRHCRHVPSSGSPIRVASIQGGRRSIETSTLVTCPRPVQGDPPDFARPVRQRCSSQRPGDQRLDVHPGDRLGTSALRSTGRRSQPVGGLHVEARGFVARDHDSTHPFQPVVTGPTRDDQAQWPAVDRRQRFSIHLGRQDGAQFERPSEGNAADERRDLGRRGNVAAEEMHVSRAGLQSGTLEQIRQPDPRPFRLPDPRHAPKALPARADDRVPCRCRRTGEPPVLVVVSNRARSASPSRNGRATSPTTSTSQGPRSTAGAPK